MLQGLEEPPDDITDKDGSNALHNAVYHLQLDIARFLIGLGCNVNLQSRNGDAPLHLVGEAYRNCCGQVEEVVEVLVQAGADIAATNKKGKTALELASRRKGVPPQAIRLLTEGERLNCGSTQARLLLTIAAFCCALLQAVVQPQAEALRWR